MEKHHVNVLLSEEEVDAKIKELGELISKDYAGKEIHLVCVLRGGSFFMCELAKRITIPVSFDFMSVSSYGADTKSSGVVKIVKDLDEPLVGKDVIVIEAAPIGNANLKVVAKRDDVTGEGYARIDDTSYKVVFDVTIGGTTYRGESTNAVI